MEINPNSHQPTGSTSLSSTLGNIQRPLDVIYDFVKFQSDPETWYITDFSQNIPYDNKLNKDRW